MAFIRFTANSEDLSTDRGYQFKFCCDKCGNGYMSRFQPSITGMARTFLDAAGDLFGGWLHSASNSAYEIQRAVGNKAHDEAFATAVEEAKAYFHQCTRCGKWVCPEICWNPGANLCEDCAPNYQEDFAASHAQAKTDAARQQLREKAQEANYIEQANLSAESVQSTPDRIVVSPMTNAANAISIVGIPCIGCGAVSNSKFCPECGQPMNARLCCKGCGAELEGKPKFCKECGARIEYGT